jgi:hypothetical protein
MMYRTSINGQQVVIRFPLLFANKNQLQTELIFQTVLSLGERLLLYKNDCLAINTTNGGLIILYIQDGEVLDVQIQQVVPNENILSLNG